MITSTFQRGLLLGAALLVGMPLNAAAKCVSRGPDGRVRQPLVVIDGRQGSQSDALRLTLIPASMYVSIYAMHLVRWNPADSTYNQTGNGICVTQVVTRQFMHRLVADLEEVAGAQQSFFATRGTYSARLEELVIRDDLAEGVSIELSAGPTGWAATATKGLMVHRCVVRLSEVPPPKTPSSSQPVATQPVRQLEASTCFLSIDASRKHALHLEG